MRSFLIATAVLAATVAVIPARAGSVAPGATLKVSYADLDLSSRRDAARLNRRIAAAVEQVCGSYATANRDDEAAITACRASAMTSTRTQLAKLAGATQLASR